MHHVYRTECKTKLQDSVRLLITSAVIPLAKVCFKNEEQENELLPVLKQMHEDKSWRVRQAYTKEIVEILKVKWLISQTN